MSLKDADMLVKKGDYAGALKAIQAEKQRHPGNKYADAYKERILALLRENAAWPLDDLPRKAGTTPDAPVGAGGVLSPENRLRDIATPLATRTPEDEKAAALKGRIDTLLSSAQEALAQQKYEVALDAVRRAGQLDPQQKEIRIIEERIRAAFDETRARAARAQQERDWADRLQRERRVQEEFDRIRKEREEKRQGEEARRRQAQEQKIAQSLLRVREFLGAGQVEEAQCELAFVSVLAPGAPEVLQLEAELTRKQEEAEQARQEAERRKVEEARERAAFIRNEISRCVAEAEELSRAERFDEALRILTEGYLLDPNSEAVEACENRILASRLACEARAEVDRQAAEEAIRQAEADARSRREEEDRLRFLAEEAAREEEEQRAARRDLDSHLTAARVSLAGGRFREALAQVALAYMIDPLADDVKSAEEEILREMNSRQEAIPVHPAPAELSPEVEADLAASARMLAEAKRLAADHRYVAALYEAQKALAIDPDNLTTRRVVSSIQADYERYQEEQKRGGPAPEGRGKSSARRHRLSQEERSKQNETPGQLSKEPEQQESPTPDEGAGTGTGRKNWWGRVKEAWREAALEEDVDWRRSVDTPPRPAQLPAPPPSPSRPPSSAMQSTYIRLP